MNPIKILLVDDHTVLREGLRLLLASNDNFLVVGEASDGKEALDRVRQLRPDVVLMDIAMPKMDGLEATRQIKKENPATKVLVLTQHDSRPYVLRILKAGASGYILKKAASTDLLRAILEIHEGHSFLDPGVTDFVINQCMEALPLDPVEAAYETLSDREKEVLKLIAEGRTNQEVADLLCVSINTVLTHRTSLMRKLNLHSRTDLIKYAIRAGVIDLET